MRAAPRAAILIESMRDVGYTLGSALADVVQVELLDRKRWSTRVELANAMFEYLETFHNRKRRHSSLGMLTPVEFEARRRKPTTAA